MENENPGRIHSTEKTRQGEITHLRISNEKKQPMEKVLWLKEHLRTDI